MNWCESAEERLGTRRAIPEAGSRSAGDSRAGMPWIGSLYAGQRLVCRKPSQGQDRAATGDPRPLDRVGQVRVGWLQARLSRGELAFYHGPTADTPDRPIILARMTGTTGLDPLIMAAFPRGDREGLRMRCLARGRSSNPEAWATDRTR